jgi:hypothetical protein
LPEIVPVTVCPDADELSSMTARTTSIIAVGAASRKALCFEINIIVSFYR